MTDFSDFCTQVAEYANRGDWAPAIVTGFVRQAEEKLNSELRIDRMIQFEEALIASRCAPLPDDWLQMELVRIANPNVPDGFIPIRYKSRDEFFTTVDTLDLRFLHHPRAPDFCRRHARHGQRANRQADILRRSAGLLRHSRPAGSTRNFRRSFFLPRRCSRACMRWARRTRRWARSSDRRHDHEAERAPRNIARERLARDANQNEDIWMTGSILEGRNGGPGPAHHNGLRVVAHRRSARHRRQRSFRRRRMRARGR